MTVTLPDDSQRLCVIGRTGSGKTQAGMFNLSLRSYDVRPWTIFDFKGDKLIRSVEPIEYDVTEKPPTEPGLYVVRPHPSQKEEVDALLWRIWAQEGHGVYVDEGYMMGEGDAFRALLTQGRSKQIPMIVLSQRPVWMSRFVWSESDFFQVFSLNDIEDRKQVRRFVPVTVNYASSLPRYNSFWFDVASNQLTLWQPVPDASNILERFEARKPKRRKFI